MTDPSAPLIPFVICFPLFGMGMGKKKEEEEEKEKEEEKRRGEGEELTIIGLLLGCK